MAVSTHYSVVSLPVNSPAHKSSRNIRSCYLPALRIIRQFIKSFNLDGIVRRRYAPYLPSAHADGEIFVQHSLEMSVSIEL